jgi:glutamine cyclotransferase
MVLLNFFKTGLKMRFPLYFFSVLILLSVSCCNKKTRISEPATPAVNSIPVAELVAPKEGETFRCGDSVAFRLRIKADSMATIDSATITSGMTDRQVYVEGFEKIYWKSEKARVGTNTLKVNVFRRGQKESHAVNIILLSDKIPVDYRYRVIQQFPHDEEAWTQGLVYEKGVMYESTGLEGKSSLRIVDLKSGIPTRRINLEEQFFAEGIALLRDQIFQVTWTSQVGFIYDKRSLEVIRKFNYPIKQGWGLTTGENRLIMSDGSAQLYFLEPEYFTQSDQIEVFDNKGMVNNLNELEYIHGKILANIWYKSIIVIIDPVSGKITGQIDLKELIPPSCKGDSNKVLNGIAYNSQNGHIYVTGKYWPVLYELEITPKL